MATIRLLDAGEALPGQNLGSNGYDRELGFDPIVFLSERLKPNGPVAWLDLCCGSGKALFEAATIIHAEGLDVQIVGVDLVGMFRRRDPSLTCLRLVEASLSAWRPERAFDLITCVHGLHYVGDKLGLIARADSWLADDGLFVANLGLANLKLSDGRAAGRKVPSDLRRAGLEYDRGGRPSAAAGGWWTCPTATWGPMAGPGRTTRGSPP